MKPHVRPVIAAVALAHANSRKISAVFDAGTGYRMIDAEVSGTRVEAFDFDRGCHFDGDLPSLYHYGDAAFVDFEVKGSGKYAGYDYATASFYEVTVRGREAEIYDYGDASFHTYSE